MNIQFKVAGTHCQACKAMIEDIATDFPEIKACEVNVQTGEGSLEYDDGFDINKFKEAVDAVKPYNLEFK